MKIKIMAFREVYKLFVNAWMPLPEPYKQNDEGAEK